MLDNTDLLNSFVDNFLEVLPPSPSSFCHTPCWFVEASTHCRCLPGHFSGAPIPEGSLAQEKGSLTDA